MNSNITVTIETEDDDVPEPEFIASIVQGALHLMDSDNAEINVQVVDNETIRSLNQRFRNQDKSTNVLSFEAQAPEWLRSDFLGDIVLCAAVIKKEASEYHKSEQSRWAHMLVHGTLHLLGMSHDNTDEQQAMEFAELKIMAQLGFEDPYEVLM